MRGQQALDVEVPHKVLPIRPATIALGRERLAQCREILSQSNEFGAPAAQKDS